MKNLIKNGWLTEEEAKLFEADKEMTECMDLCTSPKKTQIFNALDLVPFDKVKVVILGKDPYPNPKDAHGLAFSSKDSKTPDSLKNIFKSIDETYGSNLFGAAKNDLTEWAKQGVLLLNTGLTFQKIQDSDISSKERDSLQAGAQRKHMRVWKPFVNLIIKKILTIKDRPVVMMLWGNDAHNLVFSNIKEGKEFLHSRKEFIVPNTSVLLLQTSHPSPLSVNRGGDFPVTMPEHFRLCDKYLGGAKIVWTDI